MRITVKAGGLLYEHLPAQRTGNRATLELEPGATADSLLRQLGFPSEGSYLVIVNGELVPGEQRASLALAEGDKVSINPPLKGG